MSDHVQFPVVHDIQYVNGIRVTRSGQGWVCPHAAFWGAHPEEVAFSCAQDCEAHPSDSGYPVDDPKHPEYHSAHADIWDLRERG